LAEPDRPPSTRIAVCGATGATGSLVVAELSRQPGWELVGALVAPAEAGAELPGGVIATADHERALERAQAVIDFSAPAGTAALLDALRRTPLPAVLGTTGLDATHEEGLTALARQAPVVVAPNMSLGVNVLRRLVRDAGRALGTEWDVELVEVHHRRKVDAPSGTALALLDDLGADAEGVRIVGGRHGAVGPRRDDEIGVHAVRGGDVPGEHTVFLFGSGERLELTHRAGDRRIFALGALRAARWVVEPGRAAGRYSMDEVLFGNDG
jgi:4-hydroxy-tetrahydrodipicolinate reductase